ncbi:RTA1 like protein-domain-containing protein [Rhexocercosporidium sp. MPI-PUGE-AT-0058]|nr:RTA1 like protein-domain-containing protein [Rhexocercosporidium sp. MPI-PUGE-AT-0058]
MTKCLPVTDPKNMWTYCPSLPLSAVFAVLFFATTAVHIFQAHKFRKSFCWVLIMGAIWETAAFVIRCISIENPTIEGAYDPQFILILLAPLWINAFAYMVLGRMVFFFLENKRLYGVKAERMALVFVLLDLASFAIQFAGGLLTISKNFQTLQTGLRIYTAGVALQEFFILCFLFLVWTFQRRLSRECVPEKIRKARGLLWVVYVVLGLITFRILFRIIEFSAGAGTSLTHEFRSHEWYAYVFDSAPMFIALVVLNIWHPGRVLVGKESEFKSRKERRRQRKMEKERGEMGEGVVGVVEVRREK